MQTWSISPKLPEAFIQNENTGSISGKCDFKYTKEHKLTVKGDGSTYSAEFQISVLRALPIDEANLVSKYAADGASIGHGACEFIDNSIDAQAKKIEVRMSHEDLDDDTDYRRPWLMVIDDGTGIKDPDDKVSEEALSEALGIATSPSTKHESWRLGAFGVGLPAAALTSAKYCTVFTKADGIEAIGHMSLPDMTLTNQLRIFDLEDIPEFLTKAKSFENAMKVFKKMEHGTIVLLQDVFKISNTIRDRNTILSYTKYKTKFALLKQQLIDYLRLIYHHFLDGTGAELRTEAGGLIRRKISIKCSVNLTPLDPLMTHLDSKKLGKKGTHINEFDKAECIISGKSQYFKLKMAVIPGRKDQGGMGRFCQDGTDHDPAMQNAMAMFLSPSTVGLSSPSNPDAQGLYLYRNSRLIEFMTWKDIYTKSMAKTTAARCAVYTPQGLPVFDATADVYNDFSVNQRKTYMNCTSDAVTTIEGIIKKSRVWYEHGKESAHPLYARATKRSIYDGKKPSKKKPTVDVPSEAVIEPSTIENQKVPFSVQFKDLTPNKKKNSTIEWHLTGPGGNQSGDGEKFDAQIDNHGEHKIVLTIKSGNKTTHQKSYKFKLSKQEEKPAPEPGPGEPQEFVVEKKKSSSSKPPVFLEDKKIILNPDHEDYASILDEIENKR